MEWNRPSVEGAGLVGVGTGEEATGALVVGVDRLRLLGERADAWFRDGLSRTGGSLVDPTR
jgi:hypothetical protein